MDCPQKLETFQGHFLFMGISKYSLEFKQSCVEKILKSHTMNNQIIGIFSKITFDQILGFIYFLISTAIAVWTVYYKRVVYQLLSKN